MATTCDLTDRIIGIPGKSTCDPNPIPTTELIDTNLDDNLPISQQYDNTRVPDSVIPDKDVQNTTGFMLTQYKACKRISSECRKQKAFFLLHAVGSGKTITSLCMVFNMHPSIQTTVLTIRGLETAFREEYGNMKEIYDSNVVDDRFNKMRYMFYDEFSSYLITLSFMSEVLREEAVSKLFLNRFLILDEAHKILSILEKDPSGNSERMMYYIFSKCAKVIFMTATPLQKDWSDFGTILKLVAKINDPGKLNSIRTWDERSFKKSFWFPADLSPNWKIQDNLYTLVFFKIIAWSSFIENQRNSFNSILSIGKLGPQLDSIIKKLLRYAPTQSFYTVYNYFKSLPIQDPGVLSSLALAGACMGPVISGITPVVNLVNVAAMGLGALSSTAMTAMTWVVFLKIGLQSMKGALDLFSIKAEPIDIQQVSLLFMPYISFNDYKSTELDHIHLINNIRKRKQIRGDTTVIFDNNDIDNKDKDTLLEYENVLARFPNLNVENIDIKLEWYQASMQYFNNSKGYVPLASDLYLVGRISAEYTIKERKKIEEFKYIDSSMKKQDNISVLQSVLRSVGNFSLDCLEYLPLFDKTSKTFFAKQLSDTMMKNFHGTETYENDIKPRLEKQNEVKRKYIEQIERLGGIGVTTKLPAIFSCPKFEKALTLITEARKQFLYLPVVYSNFMDQGLKRFSAFLTSKKLPHIILEPSVLAENPNLINEIQKPFFRWMYGPNSIGHFDSIHQESDIRIKENVRKLEEYVIFHQPCCILLDPSLQEGLSLVFNEVMICLEPMSGYGNKEQVYGRIVRSYSDSNKIINIKNYELYNETETVRSEIKYGHDNNIICKGVVYNDSGKIQTKINSSKEDYKIKKNSIIFNLFTRIPQQDKPYIYINYIKSVSSYKSPFFRQTAKYKSEIYKDHLKSRPEKYCFQLISKLYQGAKEDDIIKINTKELFRRFIQNIGFDPNGFLKSLVDKIPENISTPILYNNVLKNPNFINAEEGQQKRLWIHFICYYMPFFTYAINWDMLLPYSMIYSSMIELDASFKNTYSTNPQLWSEIAQMGIVDTNGKPTSDQYWHSQNILQEIEFNSLRSEFNKITDSETDKLYPTTDYVISLGRQEHFANDRYGCEDSDIYYTQNTRRHISKKRCMISAKRTRENPDTCDRVGPITKSLVGAGRHNKSMRKRKNKMKGGLNQSPQLQELQQLQQVENSPRQNQEQDQNILQLMNIYNKSEQCISLCESIPTEDFIKEFLTPFVNLTDIQARELLEKMVSENVNKEENLGLV